MVIGGGPTGVELTGALGEISRQTIARDFRVIDPTKARVVLLEGGSRARIGVTNSNSVFGANTSSGNTTDGLGMFYSASAFIGGNIIDSNGAFGINIGQAAANLVGGNTITNNHQTGVLVRAGSALISDPGFGPPTSVNTISGNGNVGPTQGGIWALEREERGLVLAM